MLKRSSRRGLPRHRNQPGADTLTSPLIPLQENAQPLIPLQEFAQPLIPLQVPSPRAKLQHELNHPTAIVTSQTGTAAAPLATRKPRRYLYKRQNVVTTTITDANVVVINGSGSTITVASITNVPTGSVVITLPFTTVTIEPLASITGPVSISPAAGATSPPDTGPLPSLSSANSANPTPAPGSAPSGQNSSVQATSSAPSPTSTSAISAPSQSGNNNLGQSTTTSGVISSTTSGTTSVASTTTSSSSSSTPSTLSTIGASALNTDSQTSSSASPTPTTSSSTSASASTESSSSLSSSSSSSLLYTSTSGVGSSTIGSAAPSSISNTPAASTTAAAAAPGGSSVNAPVVGGVVGGLAGLALLLGLLLILLRWWRKRRSRSMLRSIDDEVAPPGTSHSNAPMSQNPASTGPGLGAAAGGAVGGAAAGAGLGAMLKRMTGGSTATSDTVTSEKGFQNFGGRKLESVLVSGGDGYGEPSAPGSQTPSSFYRGWAERFPYDTPSQHSSMIVGPATPYRRPSSSIAELTSSRPDSDTIRTMPASSRPAPSAAWPLTNTSAGRPVGPSTSSESSDSVLPLPALRTIDSVGRSRPSQDGSRNSRFTEGL